MKEKNNIEEGFLFDAEEIGKQENGYTGIRRHKVHRYPSP